MVKLNSFLNIDCMKGMAEIPDLFFEIAICDPPYGIGNFVQVDGNVRGSAVKWNDAIPDENYFKELKRVSKNQVIFGANYFPGLQGGRIIFNKLGKNIGRRKQCRNFSEAEIAFQSFNNLVKIISYTWIGNVIGDDYVMDYENKIEKRIHPCQKPIELYRDILKRYAKPGDKILDTHAGSASCLIACIDMKFKYLGYEIDPDYHRDASARIKNHTDQLKLI